MVAARGHGAADRQVQDGIHAERGVGGCATFASITATPDGPTVDSGVLGEALGDDSALPVGDR